MAPQPLWKVRRNAIPNFGHQALRKRPQLAIRVAETVAAWAQAEVALGLTAATLLGGNASTVMAMHASLNGFQPRADSLLAAARTRLSAEDGDLFEATLGVIRKAATKRHEFAHWLWGHCDELPDALLLVEPKELWARSAQVHEWGTRSFPPGGYLPVATPQLVHPKSVWVYREPDFDEAFSSVTRALLFADELTFLVAPSPAEHDVARHQLCNEPEIRRALDKLHTGAGPRQEVLPRPRQTSDVY